MHFRYYLGHFLDNFPFQEQPIMVNPVGHGKMISSEAIKSRVETDYILIYSVHSHSGPFVLANAHSLIQKFL